MIYYIPMPVESFFSQLMEPQPTYQELEISGGTILVEQTGNNQGRVVRLISTNPRDYLRAEYQPGTEVKYVPTIE